MSGLLLWRFLQTQAHNIIFIRSAVVIFPFSASYFACRNQETVITNELNMKKVFVDLVVLFFSVLPTVQQTQCSSSRFKILLCFLVCMTVSSFFIFIY